MQVSAFVEFPPEQLYPGKAPEQSAKHPIPSVESKSSHPSEVTQILSPQMKEQLVVPFERVDEQLNPVNIPAHVELQPLLSVLFPSSHTSLPIRIPSPQTGKHLYSTSSAEEPHSVHIPQLLVKLKVVQFKHD